MTEMSSEDWNLFVIDEDDAARYGVPDDQREVLVARSVWSFVPAKLRTYPWIHATRLGDDDAITFSVHDLDAFAGIVARYNGISGALLFISPNHHGLKFYVLPDTGENCLFTYWHPIPDKHLQCPRCGEVNALRICDLNGNTELYCVRYPHWSVPLPFRLPTAGGKRGVVHADVPR